MFSQMEPIVLPPGGIGPTPPPAYFTKLLLHMDDVALSDSSQSAHTITKIVTIRSSTQSKFGGYSAYFDGISAYLSIPDSPDWSLGTGDFTIDFWYRLITDSTNMILSHQLLWNNDSSIVIQYHQTTSNLNFYYYQDGTTQQFTQASWAPSINTWYHLAFVRNGTQFGIYIDGILTGGFADFTGVNIFDSSQTLEIGRARDTAAWGDIKLDGYIDEFRFSKGIARWTSNFTPPTAPYTPD